MSNTEKTYNLFPTPLYWRTAEPITRHTLTQEFERARSTIDRGLQLFEQYEYAQPRKTDEYSQLRAAETYGLEQAQVYIDGCVREFVQQLGYADMPLRCERMWFNRVDTGDSHVWHSHGNSIISGTLYYRVPAGDIEFRTPNPFARAGMFPVKNEWCPVISRTPAPGDIGLWPSYLEHRVTQNTSTEPRYAMSFDYVDRR